MFIRKKKFEFEYLNLEHLYLYIGPMFLNFCLFVFKLNSRYTAIPIHTYTFTSTMFLGPHKGYNNVRGRRRVVIEWQRRSPMRHNH